MLDYAIFYNSSLIADVGLPLAAELTHPFWLFNWAEVSQPEVLGCSFILFFSAVLCSAAGIGGGGIYVAVLMVCGRLTPHNAVPLSKAIVFFGSISSLVVNLYYSVRWRGNPNGGKAVIDTDACRLVVPATLIGTFLGVLLNRHTSDYIIVILLTVVLGFMTCMVTHTARKQAIEERENDVLGTNPPPVASNDNGGDAEGNGVGMRSEETPLLGRQQQACGLESMVMVPPCRKQALCMSDAVMGCSLLSVVVTGGILRFHMHACRAEVLSKTVGGPACNHPVNMVFHHQMEKWMGNDTTATILQQLVWSVPIWMCIAITIHFGFVANREVGWNPRSVVAYQIVSILTGLLAGLVGVGGGLILSPFFLLTGMDPAVAVGTSATCVLFTSSSTTMQYIFTDRIMMASALVYGMVTLVASFTGTALVHYIQDRYSSRKSYITTIVAVGVAISAMLSVVKFVYLVANPTEAGAVSLIGGI